MTLPVHCPPRAREALAALDVARLSGDPRRIRDAEWLADALRAERPPKPVTPDLTEVPL